jgi:hypothetical protein
VGAVGPAGRKLARNVGPLLILLGLHVVAWVTAIAAASLRLPHGSSGCTATCRRPRFGHQPSLSTPEPVLPNDAAEPTL